MNNEEIVSLTGLKTPYEYRELGKVDDESLRSYAVKTRELFAPIAKSFDDDKNTEWLIRSYLALKYVLASTVLGTSALHAEDENLKITLPYLNYYTMLNCARAFLFTLPCIEWKDDRSIAMTHQNIIKTTIDKLRRLDNQVSKDIYCKLSDGQKQRELFSYRFPASGLSLFGDKLIAVEDGIETARLFTDLAQFNLACLESSVEKHTKNSFNVGGQNNLRGLMRYNTMSQKLLDDDDYHRVGYLARKHKHPSELILLAKDGLVEDFFGSWTNDDEDAAGYNPDDNWSLLLDLI